LPEGRGDEAKGDAEILKVACETQKISSACMGLALMLKYGTATGQRDNDAAKPYWAKLTELKDLNGFREKTSEEGRAALARAQQECDEGRSRACNQVGWAAYGGVQREASVADSFRAYAEGCRLGSALGCRWAGHLAFTYDELMVGRGARALLERGCNGGNPSACAELGLYADKYESGAQAPMLFEQACKDGARDGCFLAGKKKMDTGKPARKEGAALLKKACDAEHEEACDQVGPMLERGGDLPRDEGAAITAYQRGCKGKQEASCAALSRLVGAGKGERCVVDPKRPPRIGEAGVKALKQACREHADAPWCKGIASCPLLSDPLGQRAEAADEHQHDLLADLRAPGHQLTQVRPPEPQQPRVAHAHHVGAPWLPVEHRQLAEEFPLAQPVQLDLPVPDGHPPLDDQEQILPRIALAEDRRVRRVIDVLDDLRHAAQILPG
jgi:TPR repeat protein